MDLEKFALATLEVLEEGNVATYAPTFFLLPDEGFRVIEGIPLDLDHGEAIQDMAGRMDLRDSDFLFGVRSGAGEITVGHYTPTRTQFLLISGTKGRFQITQLDQCAWWHFGAGGDH